MNDKFNLDHEVVANMTDKELSAYPSAPPPSEQALREVMAPLLMHSQPCDCGFCYQVRRATSRVISLFDAQQAETEKWRQSHMMECNKSFRLTAELSSQQARIEELEKESIVESELLTTLDAIVDTLDIDGSGKTIVQHVEELVEALDNSRAELALLRETALTPEEAKHVYTAHAMASCVICDTLRPKLLSRIATRDQDSKA